MIRTAIKQQIKDSGIKQKEFCVEIGVAESNFSAFLSGTRSLPYDTLIVVFDKLNLSVGTKGTRKATLPPSELSEIFRSHASVSGMKVKEISEKTGVDSTCLTSFFNGYRHIPVKNLEKVMEVLNLDVLEYINPRKKSA